MIDNDELQRRLKLLKKMFEDGRISFASNLEHGIESIKKVRMKPDGSVDLSTVDGSVRALAIMAAVDHDRTELKKIPLADVQKEYFWLVEHFFGHQFREMKKNNVSKYEIARFFSSHPNIVKDFEKEQDKLTEAFTKFWEIFGPVVRTHLEDFPHLKSVYGGSLFPQGNIASSAGLYMDTIVLPDPLMRVIPLGPHSKSTEQYLYELIKHALSVLEYKDLALAEVDPPIVVIASSDYVYDEDYRKFLWSIADTDLLLHSEKIFGRSFKDADELNAFLVGIERPEDVVAKLKQPQRLLFDTEWKEEITEQIRHFIKDTADGFDLESMGSDLGSLLFRTLKGRMLQANDLDHFSRYLRGTPLLDAETSWQYLMWTYEYAAERSGRTEKATPELVITRALQAEGNPVLKLITNLPTDVLIELRKEGAMSDLREIIKNGISEIDLASGTDVAAVSETVTQNLSEAITKHQEQIQELIGDGKKFFGRDVVPWIAEKAIILGIGLVDGIAAVVAEAGTTLMTLNMDSASFKDMIKTAKKLLGGRKQMQHAPTGILLKHIKKSS